MAPKPSSIKKDIYGGYILPSFFYSEEGQILQALFVAAGVIPFLMPEGNEDIYYELVNEMFDNGVLEDDVKDGEMSNITSTVADIQITFSPATISSAFPDLSSTGSSSVLMKDMMLAWSRVRGSDPFITGEANKKADFDAIHYALAEEVDRCFICRSGSHHCITMIQWEAIAAIILQSDSIGVLSSIGLF